MSQSTALSGGFSDEILTKIRIEELYHRRLSWIEVNSAVEDQFPVFIVGIEQKITSL